MLPPRSGVESRDNVNQQSRTNAYIDVFLSHCELSRMATDIEIGLRSWPKGRDLIKCTVDAALEGALEQISKEAALGTTSTIRISVELHSSH